MYNMAYGQHTDYNVGQEPWALRRVPAKHNSSTLDAEGHSLTNSPVTKGNNGAETQMRQPLAPELKSVDNQFDTPIWFSGENATDFSYSDLVTDYENKHLWFNDVYSRLPIKDKFTVYGNPQTGANLENTQKFVNSIEPYQVIEGNYQTTDGIYYVLKS